MSLLNRYIILLVTAVCSFSAFYLNKKAEKQILLDNGKLIFEYPARAAGDAKIINNGMIIYSYKGFIKIKTTDLLTGNTEDIELDNEIRSNWMTAVAEPNGFTLATSSFSDKDLRIYNIAGSKVELLSKIIKDKDVDLQIDPALVKINKCDDSAIKKCKNIYIISTTEIRGYTNTFPQKGKFKISFYKSEDLKKWKKISNIEILDRSLEDPKLYYATQNNKIYFLYEAEYYDKGPSEIHIAESSDFGFSWHDSTVINDGHDNEPAGLTFCPQPVLYFSSDKKQPGKSYAGANGYSIKLVTDSEQPTQPKEIPVGDRVLLLDIADCNKIVGIRDYLDPEKKSLFYYSLNITD